MVSTADLAAAGASGAAVLAVTLLVVALRAWRATRSARRLWLAGAFAAMAVQALVTALLLGGGTQLSPAWLALPLLQATTLALMYVALLRV